MLYDLRCAGEQTENDENAGSQRQSQGLEISGGEVGTTVVSSEVLESGKNG